MRVRGEWKRGKANAQDLKKKRIVSQGERKGLRIDANFANVRASESHLRVGSEEMGENG